MKILTWNMRGTNFLGRRLMLTDKIAVRRYDILRILEHKLKSDDAVASFADVVYLGLVWSIISLALWGGAHPGDVESWGGGSHQIL